MFFNFTLFPIEKAVNICKCLSYQKSPNIQVCLFTDITTIVVGVKIKSIPLILGKIGIYVLPYYFRTASIAANSSAANARFFSVATFSSIYSTLLAPIKTDVTRSSLRTHASAICARLCSPSAAILFNAVILPASSSVMSDGFRKPSGYIIYAAEIMP